MCFIRYAHMMRHDQRPVIALIGHSETIVVVPYTKPIPCRCGSGDHIAPGLRCDDHDCCMVVIRTIRCPMYKTCGTPVQYHAYEQAYAGSSEPWPVIESIDAPLATLDPRKYMMQPRPHLFVHARHRYLSRRLEVQQMFNELVNARDLLEYACLAQTPPGRTVQGIAGSRAQTARMAREYFLFVYDRICQRIPEVQASLRFWGSVLGAYDRENYFKMEGLEYDHAQITQMPAWQDSWARCIPGYLEGKYQEQLASETPS